MLSVHRTRQETNYAEVKEQFARNVLEAQLANGLEAYYNKNIMSRYFKPQEFGTSEYEQRTKNISVALKAAYKSGRLSHPLKGKPHPSRGKKLPQTGHHKTKGMISITNGVETRRIWPIDPIPQGWKRGLTRKQYIPLDRKIPCAFCRKEMVFTTKEKKRKYCSDNCQNDAHSQRMKQRYDSGEHPLKERNDAGKTNRRTGGRK